jgi:hypothetical protein
MYEQFILQQAINGFEFSSASSRLTDLGKKSMKFS